MYKQILSFLLCIVMILSFSVVSFAEEDRIPEVGDHVFFGQYEQDNDLNNGTEPIEWRVLEVKGDKMLLLSEYILEAMPFNEEVGNQWSSSSLRHWLNNDFMTKAFEETEADAIQISVVDNSAKQTNYLTNGSSDTEDHVFLLSFAEVISYFSSPNQSRSIATAYAKPNLEAFFIVNSFDSSGSFRSTGTSTVKDTFEDYEYAPWWYRSQSYSWDKAVASYFGEDIYGTTFNKNYLSDYDYRSSLGVRPAMWVDINQYLDLLPAEEAESEAAPVELTVLTSDGSITADTVLGDTPWKMWLPEGFEADELTEADIADDYIGYYLRDDDIIAVQYSDNSVSLAGWQKELADRGFEIKGLYNLNGSEAVLYRDEDADTMTASVLDGKGKLLEVTFYPYSSMSEEADSVISSIQQEASKKRLSGAAGSSKSTSGSEEATDVVPTAASQEEAYQKMVDAYKAGKYKDSYSYYEQAKGYQDADKYGNLLKARLCFDLKLKDSEIEDLEKAIVNDIDFADSKDVLVCNSKMAHFYLLGYWRTSNGMHGYEVRSDWYSNTTVPAIPKSGDYYTIMDGTYWSYFDGKWDDRVAQYKFTPISKNQMEMYSYQVKQSYTFSKIR